jgi:outer membrane cobalamin receptor
MRARIVIAAAGFLLAACQPQPNEQMEYNASVITEAEIAKSGAQNAYDVIKKLRANFLAVRGRTSLNASDPQAQVPEPNVWLDGQYFGPLNALKSIPANQIGSIRMYRSWEVAAKFGTNNLGGVIEIFTRQ